MGGGVSPRRALPGPRVPARLPGQEFAWRTGGSEGRRSPALTSSRVGSGRRHLEELSFKKPRSVGRVQLAGRPAPGRSARESGAEAEGLETARRADVTAGRPRTQQRARLRPRRIPARGEGARPVVRRDPRAGAWRTAERGGGARQGRSTRLATTCLRLAGLAPNPGVLLSVLPTRFVLHRRYVYIVQNSKRRAELYGAFASHACVSAT